MTNPFTKSASRFRIVLLSALLASVIIVVCIVIYGVQQLNVFADEVNQQVASAANSESKLSNIRSEVQQLESNQDVVKRAKKIVAESQEYQYQDKIIADIEQFANRANVKVLSYDFTAADTNENTTNPTPSKPIDTPSPGPTSRQGIGDEMRASAPQLRSTMVDISIESPVNYRNFLNFLNYIEQNLTKMQVSSVSLAGADNSSQVTTSSLQIEVYVR